MRSLTASIFAERKTEEIKVLKEDKGKVKVVILVDLTVEDPVEESAAQEGAVVDLTNGE